MQWKLFGMLPFMRAGGKDITRSAAGLMNIESLWLPSVLSGTDKAWSSEDANHVTVRFTESNEDAVVKIALGDSGEVKFISMPRWGNAGRGDYRLIPFGALVEQSGTFGGLQASREGQARQKCLTIRPAVYVRRPEYDSMDTFRPENFLEGAL